MLNILGGAAKLFPTVYKPVFDSLGVGVLAAEQRRASHLCLKANIQNIGSKSSDCNFRK